MNKELWLFTQSFPFGRGEAFLENELPTLAQRFARVSLFPLHGGEGMRPLPGNVQVERLLPDPYARATPAQLLRRSGDVRRLVSSLWQDMGMAMFSKRWRGELQSTVRGHVHRLAVLERELLPRYDPKRVVLYSYWTHEWATLLALLQATHPEVRFISRAHGFDLYEHQHASGVIPFRALQLRAVAKLFCVSLAGSAHMQARHPAYRGKYELARLGTADHGINPRPGKEGLHVASCSHVIPRKRVLLLAEALSRTTKPVHWTHFGDGSAMPLLKDRVARLPANVTVDLKGAADNAAIMRWYQENPVDVFVLTSELEGGVAVALQEAASFGIPLIATDSGGVRDIMNEQTGLLLPTQVTAAELARVLDGFKGGPMDNATFRAGVRAYWEEHFRAEATFNRFCDRLLELHAGRNGDQ
ncbi:MAG: glycosyltransferase [Flavobacteriales bacterium]|nr:glycosyltransferase [Flavobacteriales bacterium]